MSLGNEVIGNDGFAVDVDHGDGSASVRLLGCLVGDGLVTLRQHLWPLIARYDGAMVTFDCAELRRVDGEGLALLGQFGRAIAPGRPLVRRPPAPVRDALMGAGLDGVFEIEGAASR